MADIRYFLLDAADVPVAILDAEPRHKSASPGCNLSVTWNVAGTQALMKVDGADDAWRQGKAWSDKAAGTAKVYTRATHDAVFDWFNTPEWQPKEDALK